MYPMGPPPPRRDDRGSIDTGHYVERAKRCRDRALGDIGARLFAFFRGRRRPGDAARPALAGDAPRSSTSGTPPAENDDGRAHDRNKDAPGLVA
jgi:hypothetical protein